MFHAPIVPSLLAGLKELPNRLLIGKWGTNHSVNGDFVVNETTVRQLPVLQRLLGWDTVALDFEHNTLPGTAAYKADKEPRNVAGHASLSVVPGEGLYAEGIKWTPHGVKSIQEGLHPDLSPAIKTNDANEVVAIHSAALCRAGAVMDLKAFSALNVADLVKPELFAAYSAALPALASQKSTQPAMDHKKLLLLLLGIDANSSDADIETAYKNLAATLDKVRKVSDTITAHATSIESLQKRLDAADRANLVNGAIAAGKVIPHGVDSLTNDQLKAIIDGLPAGVVPLNQRTAEGVKAHAAVVQANPAADSIQRQLGVSKESLEKYGDKIR
jgi:phage I-like protein